MPVLSVNKRSKGSNKVSTYSRSKRPNIHGETIRQRITFRLSDKVASLPQNHKKKVLSVRRQLEAGTYDIKERLDMAIDRLIENLIKGEMGEDETKCKIQSHET